MKKYLLGLGLAAFMLAPVMAEEMAKPAEPSATMKKMDEKPAATTTKTAGMKRKKKGMKKMDEKPATTPK